MSWMSPTAFLGQKKCNSTKCNSITVAKSESDWIYSWQENNAKKNPKTNGKPNSSFPLKKFQQWKRQTDLVLVPGKHNYIPLKTII